MHRKVQIWEISISKWVSIEGIELEGSVEDHVVKITLLLYLTISWELINAFEVVLCFIVP